MKPKPVSAFGIFSLALILPLAAQNIYVWDNSAGTNNISTASNWTPDGVPTSTSGGISDTARWDGSVAGNLSLSSSGSFGGGLGTAGIVLDVTSSQTGNLAITGNTIRVKNIQIAAGAGSVTLGPVQIGGLASTTSHSITNNSSNGATQDVMLKGGGGTRNVTISGSGNYTINGRIDGGSPIDSNGFNFTKDGSGFLFLNGNSFEISNPWNSTLTITNGVVRISNSHALGTVGSGTTGITTISSNAGARLEFTGGISVAETLDIKGKSGGSTSSHLLNVSGNNSVTGNITLNTGGNDYNFTSIGGKLTVSSHLSVGGGSTATKNLRIAGAGDTDLTGTLSNGTGALNLVKNDGGTLTLTQDNSYSGTTTVSGGTLLANNTSGSATGSGTVNVSSGATLGGTGAISGVVNVSGVLAPGASVQTLATGTLNLQSGSTFAYELDSSVSPTVGADLQKVFGNLNLTGTVSLTLADLAATDAAFAEGTTFSLVNYTGSWNGGLFTYGGNELANLEEFTAGLNTWRITYNAAEGGSNFSSEFAGGSDGFVNITAVPEPAVSLLGGLGALLLLGRRRKS